MLAERWPRALLRAQLCEAGYDAVGAESLAQALGTPPEDPERGPVRLLVLSSDAAPVEPAALDIVRRRYPGVLFLLVHHAGAPPPGPWAAALPRPIAIGEVVAAVRRLLPPPPRKSASTA